MAQRVLIAMALGSGPRLLVADEPTSGLDVTIQAQFLDEMWRNVRKVGSAALLMTQDLGIIANYCDRVVVLQNGRQVEDAPTRSFYSSPRDSYSRSVLALRKEDPPADPVPAPLLTIQRNDQDLPVARDDKAGAGRRRCELHDRAWRDTRARRRERLGQDHRRPLHPSSDRVGPRAISSSAVSRSPRPVLRRCGRCAASFRSYSRTRSTRSTRAGPSADILAEAMETKPDKGRIAELLRLVGLGADVARAKAACAQRRLAAAGQHRPCDCCRTGTDRARRTDLRADAARAHRHHSAAARPAGTPWRLLSVHFPRPEHGGAHEPSRRRHVSRPDRRAGHARAGVPQSDCTRIRRHCWRRTSSPTPRAAASIAKTPRRSAAKSRVRSTCRAAAISRAAARLRCRRATSSRRNSFPLPTDASCAARQRSPV